MLEINNLTRVKVEKSFLKKTFQAVLDFLKIKRPFEVSLVLVGKDRIRKLNKKYRNYDKATDVLAFPFFYYQEGKESLPKRFKQDNFLGEIVICLPFAKEQSLKAGHSLKRELTVLFVHGILHLLGFNHESNDKGKSEKMKDLEKRILKKLK